MGWIIGREPRVLEIHRAGEAVGMLERTTSHVHGTKKG